MPYKDQVIHFTGGVNDYIGKLDQSPHKMGKNWYRILDPVISETVHMANGMTQFRIRAIQGNGQLYKKYVDIRIPEDSIIEIQTVDPKGELMKMYEREAAREKPSLIQVVQPAVNGGLSMN